MVGNVPSFSFDNNIKIDTNPNWSYDSSVFYEPKNTENLSFGTIVELPKDTFGQLSQPLNVGSAGVDLSNIYSEWTKSGATEEERVAIQNNQEAAHEASGKMAEANGETMKQELRETHSY